MEEKIKTLYGLANRVNDKEYGFVKLCLSFISIIIGLILSMGNKQTSNKIEFVLFVILMISTALCVLFGLAYIYVDVYADRELLHRYEEQLRRSSIGQDIRVETAPHKIFSFLRKSFFFLLIVSFVSLIFYGVYSRKDVQSQKQSHIEMTK